jgi:Fe2+ transport system protein FeoA
MNIINIMTNTLADLAIGSHGIVSEVHGEPDLRRRLLEMGLTPGTSVQLIRRAPLGDPLALRLRGYDLSLRTAEARLVQVGS